MAYQDPKRWRFNPLDFDRAVRRDTEGRLPSWYVPVRLVRDGAWAALWKSSKSSPGGGLVTSVLPVLATHVFPEYRGSASVPGKNGGDPLGDESFDPFDPFGLATPSGTGADEKWTPWYNLPRRQIAALAGVNKDSVGTAFKLLQRHGLLQLYTQPRGKSEGGYQTFYRLSTALYARNGERFFAFPKCLLYSGVWSILPTHACRHLYVVIGCLDPIRNEDAYRESLEAAGDTLSGETTEETLAARRATYPLSLARLQEASGLSYPTVSQALDALRVPFFGEGIGLIKRGSARSQGYWYAPDERAIGRYWTDWDFPNGGIIERPDQTKASQWVNGQRVQPTFQIDRWREFQAYYWPKIVSAKSAIVSTVLRPVPAKSGRNAVK
jgi:hypothetical protein